MNPRLRQNLSALGFAGVLALLFGAAGSVALDLSAAAQHVADLEGQAQALEARARRAPPAAAQGAKVSPFVDAATITLAGASLQQRLEGAVESAGGRVMSSKVDFGGKANERSLRIAAELTIAQPDMQKLLYDLEGGEPYIFVDVFEARAPERSEGSGQGTMHVSLTLSGEWGGPK